jgi:hypothetical protein
MKKLGLFAVSVAAALACTAVLASFNWSRTTGASLSLDKAEAQSGGPCGHGALPGSTAESNDAPTAVWGWAV